ncbi:MAG TPA: SRPBCC family protein [Pyrinomonadaceae bacterium]|nr:SRPBCC family protein [Pyrinomonadaceae bacterium]
MKFIIIIATSIVGLFLIFMAAIAMIFARLPKEHAVTRSILLNRPPSEVYTVVHDFASMPKWRSDVQQVEVTTQPDGRIHFRETGKHGIVNFELTEDVPEERMVTRITDTDLGYSGSWTYVFTAEGNLTRVTITENGEVSNILFRFFSRYVFGHTATIDGYLTSLAKHFGETRTPPIDSPDCFHSPPKGL